MSLLNFIHFEQLNRRQYSLSKKHNILNNLYLLENLQKLRDLGGIK